jgi:nucleoporin SEH1
MHQKNPIQTTHDDLVTDASYDFYGLRLATGSVDQQYEFPSDNMPYKVDV